MQVALVHEVHAYALAVAVSKQHVIWQHHGGTRFAVCLQASVDVLQEVQLLVAGRKREIVSGCALAALFRAEWRVCQHEVIISHGLALIG